MSLWSLTDQQSVFKQCHSRKHLWVLPTKWRRKPAGIDMERNYVTVTLCILHCFQCFDAVCWASGRASGLLKTEWLGASMVICLEQGADLHVAQLMPLPLTVTYFSKIQIGFTFLVLAHLGCPGQRAVKRVCVCVTLCILQLLVHV